MQPVRRGLVAGAVGTVVLNLVTYADMAVRGRPASSVPADVAEAATGIEDENVQEAVGALAGMGTGLGIGIAASVARAHGARLSPIAGSVLTGAAAMAASDVPIALLGVSDPRDWSRTDWASDAIPHLAYGAATYGVVVALENRDPSQPRRTHAGAGLVLRSFLLGLATGSRSSLGLVGAAYAAKAGTTVKAGSLLALAGELVGDKLPMTPSRLEPPGLAARIVGGSVGAMGLSSPSHATVDLPVLAGTAGAVAGSYAGATWRELRPGLAGALAEDVVAIGLAVLAAGRR